MWNLPIPQYSVSETLQACLSTPMRDEALRNSYAASGPAMVAASDRFLMAAAESNVHSLHASDFKLPPLTSKQLGNLYKQRLSSKDGPARHIYDDIVAQVPHLLCPLCGDRRVSTLDHYLPKRDYPALVIDPLNLVPCCKDCNYDKGVYSSTDANATPIHPYFDDVSTDKWLHARVLVGHPPALLFYVEQPKGWSQNLYRRVSENFERLSLAEYYGSRSSSELASILEYLSGKYENSIITLQADLAAMAESRLKSMLNSWQTAMYVALRDDPWFSSGGFID